MLTAKDIMTREVLTFTPDTDIPSAAKLLLEKKINGAPVVDGDRLVGVLSQTDLVAQQKQFPLPSLFTLLDGFIPLTSPERLEHEMERMTALKVGQAMTTQVVSVDPDTPITEVAGIMVDKKLHTVPVVHDERLIGVIGKEDVLRTLLGPLVDAAE